MTDINVNQLYNSVLKKEAVKYKTYESVLKLCYQKIKRYAENFKMGCLYEIPKFVIGTPLYEFDKLKQYILNSLKKKGFYIKMLNESIIYISWDLKHKQVKKVKQQKKNQYKSIIDYNPTGKFINDNTLAIQNINDKLNLINI
jgi:hypothetical protein